MMPLEGRADSEPCACPRLSASIGKEKGVDQASHAVFAQSWGRGCCGHLEVRTCARRVRRLHRLRVCHRAGPGMQASQGQLPGRRVSVPVAEGRLLLPGLPFLTPDSTAEAPTPLGLCSTSPRIPSAHTQRCPGRAGRGSLLGHPCWVPAGPPGELCALTQLRLCPSQTQDGFLPAGHPSADTSTEK